MTAKTTQRSYHQACSLARSLDLIGERWTFLILRELFAGPRRFKDILGNLKGIGTNLLSDRLRALKNHGIIEDIRLPAPASIKAIALTEVGRQLEQPLVSLAKWGMNFSTPKKTNEHWSPAWNHIALKARFNPEKAQDLKGCIGFNISEYQHFFRIADGKLETGEGIPSTVDALLTATNENFLNWIEARETLEDSLTRGKIKLEGNQKLFFKLLSAF